MVCIEIDVCVTFYLNKIIDLRQYFWRCKFVHFNSHTPTVRSSPSVSHLSINLKSCLKVVTQILPKLAINFWSIDSVLSHSLQLFDKKEKEKYHPIWISSFFCISFPLCTYCTDLFPLMLLVLSGVLITSYWGLSSWQCQWTHPQSAWPPWCKQWLYSLFGWLCMRS